MLKGVSSVLRLSVAVLIFSGYFSLLTTDQYNVIILAIPIVLVALMPVCERLDVNSRYYRSVTGTVTLLFAIFGLPILPFLLGVVGGLVVLFMYIQAYLLLHVKKPRDYHYLILMSFFFLVSACHLNPEPSYGLTLGLFMISAVWTFVTLMVFSESQANAGRPWAEIVMPNDRDGYSPGETIRLFDRNLIGALTVLSTGAVLSTFGIFLLTPRMEAGVLGGSAMEFHTTGLTETVDLSKGGTISSDPAPVMSVRLPDEPDGKLDSSLLYWRVSTLNRFLGATWDRVPASEDHYRLKNRRVDFYTGSSEVVDRGPTGRGREVKQEIFLDDLNADALPCLSLVRRLSVPGTRVDWDPDKDFTVVPVARRRTAMNYEAVSEIQQLNTDDLRHAPTNYDSVLGYDYVTFTQNRLSPKSIAFAREVTGGIDNAYDKAKAIEKRLSSSEYLYTLNVPDSTDQNPIERFLHVTKAGHCELYASAMALLLRSQGIPARVVKGYHGGEWSPGDNAYIIRKNMAHLWVEVYFINYGWVTFDPTPLQGDIEYTPLQRVMVSVSRAVLKAKIFWYSDIVGFAGTIRLGDLRHIALNLVNLDFSFVQIRNIGALLTLGAGFQAIAWASGSGMLIWAAYLVGLRRTRKQIYRQVLTADQARAVRLFGRIKARVNRFGANQRGKTAGEIALAIRNSSISDPTEIDRLLSAYSRARFGGRSLSRGEYRDLVRALRTVRTNPKSK